MVTPATSTLDAIELMRRSDVDSLVDEMEALRYARRAMIREERTRGLEWDEPSMEDPSLAGHEIRWFALASQAAWCRQKVAELVERANRAVAEMRATGR